MSGYPGRRSRPRRVPRGVVLAVATALALAGVTGAARGDDRPTVGGDALATTGTVAYPAAGVPALPAQDAAGWLVADLDTGQVLAAHDPHGRYAPASTLKILTADTLVPRLSVTTVVTATSPEADVDGTRVGIVPGHAYTVGQLFQGMLMVSGNDAATALADAAGGVGPTITAMNARAAALNADDTHAASVDGLDAPGQTSSAYDLALIARDALRLPTVAADVRTERTEFASPGVPTFQIQNHNPLLGRDPGVYGVKNGYTVAAHASYVGVARRGGHDVLVALIRTRPDFAAQASALLDWGFAADGRVAPVGLLVDPGPLPSVGRPAQATTARRDAPAAAARHDGGQDVAYLTGGVLAGLVVLLGGLRRRTVRARRRRRYARSLR